MSDPTMPDAVQFRHAMSAIPPYVPGARSAKGAGAYKLSSNENPFPPLSSVVEAIAQAAGDVNRYPDMAALDLTDAIAAKFDVDPAQIVLGTGSVAVLGHLLAAVAEAGSEVLYAWRSFEGYPIAVGLTGARSVQVPLTADGRHDFEAMADAISSRTRAILVCSPNNPTGPAVRRDEFELFMSKIPADVLVVFDEAYVEFIRDPEAVDGLTVLKRYPNIVLLRTFSKAYGLAGLRIGFSLSSKEIASQVRKASTPFGVSSLAQIAAVASLSGPATAELEERVEGLVRRRARLCAGLAAQGWIIPQADGNFVWLPLKEDAVAFAAMALESGVIVRPFDGDGVRISVGEGESVDRVLDVTARWLGRES